MRVPEPSVSVVVPSLGRPSLVRAVESALGQTRPPLEVIVVFDRGDVPSLALPSDPRVRVMCTGGGLGGNGARDFGVHATVGTLVAFLDDDDRWRPAKLERQVAAYAEARARGEEIVVATFAQIVDEAGAALAVLPRRALSDGQSVADYLLRRRSVAYGEAMLCSSMLLCSRALLRSVPLDTGLVLHQDWDWLIRVTRDGEVRVHTVAEALLEYTRQPEGSSASRSGRWRASLAWLQHNRRELSPREYGDGLLTVTVPLAIASADRTAALWVAGHALRHGHPGLPALLFALLTITVDPDRLAALSALARRVLRSGADRHV